MSANPVAYACVLDGKGGSRPLKVAEVQGKLPAQGLCWVHLNDIKDATKKWLKTVTNLDKVTVEALCAEETRPRALPHGDNLIVTLRGVNLNPGSRPEDMISVRLLLSRRLIITVQRRNMWSTNDIQDDLKKGAGPTSTADFLICLAANLSSEANDAVCELDQEIDHIEDKIDKSTSTRALRPQLADLRRRIIVIRRYLQPQREAFSRINTDKISWLDETDNIRLREVTDSVLRLLEDLDASKDRTMVTQEELMSLSQEQLNSRMYILAVLAVIFMPLSFVTGLLGINVGGIPGSGYHWAFLIVCAILLVVGCLEMLYLKLRHWV